LLCRVMDWPRGDTTPGLFLCRAGIEDFFVPENSYRFRAVNVSKVSNTGRREQRMVGVQGWPAVSEDPTRSAAEVALLAAGRAGDRAALGQLLALHERALVAFCLGILGNLEDAEDAAQETFLRALQGLAGYRGDAAFRTWLFRIAVNL